MEEEGKKPFGFSTLHRNNNTNNQIKLSRLTNSRHKTTERWREMKGRQNDIADRQQTQEGNDRYSRHIEVKSIE